MKVLHINQSDIIGGAAIAGYRLHQSLLDRGIDSRLLVGKARTNNERVAAIDRQPRREKQLSRLTNFLGLNYLNISNTFSLPKHNFYRNADILNFHNLHAGYFNYLAIPSLTKDKPAIFTLHDMWSFTGHCAYSYDCDRWQTGCGKCPYLNTYPTVLKDSTAWEWKLKDWVYSRANIAVVTLSEWLTKQVRQSMLARFSIHHIPNGIDTQAYQPLNSEHCRLMLDIPQDKKVLMFGANSLQDSRKGKDFLIEALQKLPNTLKKETVLLTIGNGGESIESTVGISTLNLGYVSSDRLKSVAYSAADLFIFPTRADNLPLVLQESMACGTPMVSFDIGGVSDLVRHNVTGYLATPNDARDLSQGILQLLEDEQLRTEMRKNCRAIAIEEYSIELQAQKYIELYHQTLKTNSYI